MGAVMASLLKELAAKHPCVSDVRSIDLFGAITEAELGEGFEIIDRGLSQVDAQVAG